MILIFYFEYTPHPDKLPLWNHRSVNNLINNSINYCKIYKTNNIKLINYHQGIIVMLTVSSIIQLIIVKYIKLSLII